MLITIILTTLTKCKFIMLLPQGFLHKKYLAQELVILLVTVPTVAGKYLIDTIHPQVKALK